MDRTQDRQLIARLQAGDDTAVQELADRYGSRIFQLAMRHMKNREDAEEVTQDVLMKVYRKVDAFRGDAALSSWIYRITFNTAMSRLRTSRLARAADQERERALAADADVRRASARTPRQPADWSRMPDEELLRAQLREAVAAAIDELPEIYRAPVVLRDIQGLTTEEASTPAAGEGSDAEVAAASRTADAARAAARRSRPGCRCTARRRRTRTRSRQRLERPAGGSVSVHELGRSAAPRCARRARARASRRAPCRRASIFSQSSLGRW